MSRSAESPVPDFTHADSRTSLRSPWPPLRAVILRPLSWIRSADLDVLVTLALFSGIGLVASLVLLVLDHALNVPLPNL